MSTRSCSSSAVAAALALAAAVVAGCSGPRSGASAITDVSGNNAAGVPVSVARSPLASSDGNWVTDDLV